MHVVTTILWAAKHVIERIGAFVNFLKQFFPITGFVYLENS